jgi:hypothetical protein
MVYQTDPEFPAYINHNGCYLFSLLYQIWINIGIDTMQTKFILDLLKAEEADFDIGLECYLNNPQGVCDYCAKDKIKMIGHKDADYICQKNEFEIQQWFNPNNEFYHFVAAEGDTVTYDPIEGGSKTVQEGSLYSKRIFLVL